MQQQQQQQYPPNAAYPPPGYAPAGQPGPPPGYAPAGQPGQPMGQYGQPGQPMGQPMAPGYAGPPPQQQQHVNTVIVQQQQQNVVAMRFGETPCPMTCHYCSASIVTSTSKVVGSMVWMWVCGICLIGCLAGGATWFGCCLIPCCISSMKDTEHHCPNCNRMVGTHSKRI